MRDQLATVSSESQQVDGLLLPIVCAQIGEQARSRVSQSARCAAA